MICEIITVGTEILIGAITNTNGPYVSRILTEKGFDVMYHTSVRDNPIDIKKALEVAISRSELIFFSGGLGPTNDDLTKEAVASALNLKLIEDQEAWKVIEKRLLNYSGKITANNRKQAQIIENSIILPNPNGSAPGDYIPYKGKKIFLLPGPPREFEPMAKYILDEYLNDNKDLILMESLNLVLIGESSCESIIRELNLENEYLEINTFAKMHEVEIKIIAHAKEGTLQNEIKKHFNHAIAVLTDVFAANIYSKGKTSLEGELVKVLIRNNSKISFAESVTGGLLAHRITSIENSSKVLEKSFVTYSNDAKETVLKVNGKVIEKFGVVSKEVASEMAKGCFAVSNSTYCVSTTGEAGPNTQTNHEKGTVCFSIYKEGKEIFSEEVKFNGDRVGIQSRASKYILSKLYFLILGGQYGE